ncbi:MAG: uroporphyrinogen decarboxylase [Micavibrio sp.]|nr:uroporphyrinogen decarboxylase [Micavibrio sp.]
MQPKKPFLKVLNNQTENHIPCWFMRQAGRYLPEYRALREEAGGFLNMVYNPENASEITLQPIRRFKMDAAILFSDILVVPQALGQKLEFLAGEGPKLNKVSNEKDLKILDVKNIDNILSPVYETIKLTRQKLTDEGFDQTALIGFAGSPWTVATYMVEGGGSKTYENVKSWAYGNPETFQKLIDILVSSTTHYLIKQIEAGVEAIQLFDSWSGVLDEDNFNKWVIVPTAQIVANVREKYPNIPIIGFPRGAGTMSKNYAEKTGITVIGLDFTMPLDWARDNLQNIMPVQGNLDPVTLLTGGEALKTAAIHILDSLSDKPFVFNLGHGVIKETPPEHVEQLVNIIRNYKK